MIKYDNTEEKRRKDKNMRNILLTIEYDGTDFCGWQIQPELVTVQQTVADALLQFEGKAVSITGAGRTDAGVHARRQKASFFTESRIPAEKYREALNTALPESVRIVKSEEVPLDFNARFSAKRKTYKYYIRNAKTASALTCRYEHFINVPLNVEKMREALTYFVGEHDFSAFMATGSTIKDAVRTIYSASVEKNGDLIIVTVTGSGFLYKMVRLTVGALVEVGTGKREPESIKALLDAKGAERATLCVPAKGLFLDDITYAEDEK